MSSDSKLLDILRDNNVSISSKGNICLNDLVKNVIESKNFQSYINNLDCAIIKVNGKLYITPSDCMKILEKSRFQRCKSICTQIYIADSNGETILDIPNGIVQFEGYRFTSFIVVTQENDWNIWIKGSEAARILGYQNGNQAIRIHVDDKNKMEFGQLLKIYTCSKNFNKKMVFINLSGFFDLIYGSVKPLARRIKKWLDGEVLPSLIKYGTYTMQPKELVFDSIYDKSTFSNYDKLSVIYIAYVGKRRGEHLFKYGYSLYMFRKDYNNYRKMFNGFEVVFIKECDNCEQVEDLFEKELESRHLHREHMINDEIQTELFTITMKHTYQSLITLMVELIRDNPDDMISQINKAEAEIFENHRLEIERRKSEMEQNIRNRELNIQTRLDILKSKILLQQAKNKQMAIESGYDLSEIE
jgi:prophage antirepressor-like protein